MKARHPDAAFRWRWVREQLRHGPWIARHPSLWGAAFHQARVLPSNGWWKAWPPLPAPTETYWHFRMETAFADKEYVPNGEELLSVLTFVQQFRKSIGRIR